MYVSWEIGTTVFKCFSYWLQFIVFVNSFFKIIGTNDYKLIGLFASSWYEAPVK